MFSTKKNRWYTGGHLLLWFCFHYKKFGQIKRRSHFPEKRNGYLFGLIGNMIIFLFGPFIIFLTPFIVFLPIYKPSSNIQPWFSWQHQRNLQGCSLDQSQSSIYQWRCHRGSKEVYRCVYSDESTLAKCVSHLGYSE